MIAKARAEARRLLHKSLPGSTRARKRHIARAEQIAETICKRYQVMPHNWNKKHLLSYLYKMQASNATKYDHYLTIRKLCAAMNNHDPFGAHRAEWMRPNGDNKQKQSGRPIIIPGRGKY